MSDQRPKGAPDSAKTTRSYLRNDGVRVDDENNLADAKSLRIVSPWFEAPSAFLIHFIDRHAQRLLLDVLVIVVGSGGIRERGFFGTLYVKPANDLFNLEAEREAVIHVAGFLKSSTALESSVLAVMFRTRHPTDAMICVEPHALFALFIGDELQAIVVNKNCRGTALPRVGLHGLLYRHDGRATKLVS